MEDVIDAIRELWAADDGGPIQRTVVKTARIIRSSGESAFAPPAGPLTLSVRAVDYILDRAGVPADTVVRAQIRRELDDLDRAGGFGVRTLDPETARGGAVGSDPGPRGSGEGVVWGIVDP